MKKKWASMILLLVLSSLMVTLPNVEIVKAELRTIVVPDDYFSIQEAIDSALEGDTIYVKKGTYHENLVINKSLSLIGEDLDTTIIDGAPSEGYRVPINIHDCENVSVSGFKLLYGYAGLQIWSVKNCNISGNRIADGQHGIKMSSSENNNITGNIFESIGLSGAIQLSSSINNLIIRNYIDSCVEGIQIWQGSDNNTVSQNTIINCKNYAIMFKYSNSNTITRNNITDSGYGTSIYVSNMNKISNNNYVNNSEQFSANEWYALTFGYNASVNTINENYWNDYNGTDTNGDGIGDTPYIIDENNQDNLPLIEPFIIPEFPSESTIYIRANGSVEGTDKIQIDGEVYTFISDINGSIRVERDNVVLNGAGYRLQGDGNQNGITLRFGNNITVNNLQLSSFHIGIVVMGSDNNKILENTITDNFRGLDFTSSENNTVSGNYIANNVGGIALENMYNSIVENTITNNSNSGIHLYGAGYNNIIGNNITNNGRGISVSICYNNVIYHNNFVNNTNHVETDDSNGIWNNGEEGNYWDDYTGVNNDGDGIGDTPYVIDDNNRNNFPLMNPWIPPNQKSEPFPITWILVIIGIIAIVGVAILVFFIKTKKTSDSVK